MTVQTDDGNEFVRSSEAWTYRMYAVGEEGRSLKIPASYEMFKWVGDSSFYDFNIEEEEVAGWQKKYSIKACSRYGTVLEYEAPIGKRQSILYDRQEGIKVAVFSLASIQDEEGFYFGFEPYEKQDKWLIEKDGVKVVEDVSFTGTRSLCVQSRKEGDGLCLSPKIKSRNYLFSCYMRCSSIGNGTAGWRVVYIENKTEILDQELIVADLREGWQYLYYQVKLNRYIDKGQVSVIFYPFNDMDNSCFIDHVLFCPYENPAMISVYDPIQYKVVANLGPYNSINRVSYDALGKVSVMYDKYENVSKISAYYLSRQSGDGFFSSKLPNSIIDFQPMGDTFYDRFYDNKLSDCWRIEDGSEWKTEKDS